jgi:hypothetical protein
MNYDPSQYRALGVGERIGANHFRQDNVGDLEIVPVTNHEVGLLVTEDTPFEYLELIPQDNMVRFATGSVRENKAGKGRYDLIPLEGIRALALHYENGAKKHGDRNWELGQNLSVFKNSLTRHAHQVAYAFDEDHAAAVAWNAFGYITTMERIRAGLLPKELDDLGVCNKEVVR